MEILRLINFQDSDTMYILGDAIDRGLYPTRTLLYIIDHPNMKMLLGNHEEMMLGSLRGENMMIACWMTNGGERTLNQYMKLSKVDQNRIDKYLVSLPFTYELDDYILVHAGYLKDHTDRDFCLWARDEFIPYPTLLDKMVIFGHTPTRYLTGNAEIYKAYDKIGIDCGAYYKGRLACLRLDDMKEFYA
jgi:serine/threonine protein phosphatase 1